MLKIVHVAKSYTAREKKNEVLKDINLELNSCQTVGLLGKNGAGKTTLIKSCLDLITYDGDILYFDKKLKDISKTEKLLYFNALLEGNRNIYWKLTPLENIKFFAALRGIDYKNIEKFVLQLIHQLDMDKKKDSLVENLSRGMQQKVALICSLAMNTPIVFLDEPTLGLDVESKENIEDFFQNNEAIKNKLIIVTSHDLNFISRISKQILCMKDGILVTYIAANYENKFLFRVKGKNIVNLLSRKQYFQLIKDQIDYVEFCFTSNNTYSINDVITDINSMNIELISIENYKYNIEHFYLQ